MNRIIGIDIGSYNTGYGIMDVINNNLCYLTGGCINNNKDIFYNRLFYIYKKINKIFLYYKPNCLVIEKNFFYKNINTLIKLSQLCGSIISLGLNYKMSIFEYSVKQIRKYVINNGNINKINLNKFICNKFNINKKLNLNTTDALAIIIAHYNFIFK